ncbi:hypothetical protein MIND_00432100 [Mycena indigotica]|uniref:Uncharacterized protein n=1 Tax=Mycena indigotica TaxID=2126181 RepID=A0A8H6SW06_9AGAR|nr:uncharacterized protein MIND_00432100 [Mycena indigotica]KAF7306409.1 hypothetical protein MIND_00432100 [Mycena indigotica]
MSLPDLLTAECDEVGPSCIPEGSSSVRGFCAWSKTAAMSVQNAVVTDLAWWAEGDTVLKHQFILLRLEHQPKDKSLEDSTFPNFYDIKIERLGKHFPSFSMLASDTVTVERVPPLLAWKSRFLRDHVLFFAHVSHLSFVLPATYMEVTKIPPLYLYRAFNDALDQHRCGPPLLLRDLTRYLEILSAQSPNYSLTSSNCFWYARLLFHIISLRHYSFPILATSFPPEKYLIPRGRRIPADQMKQIAQSQDWLTHDPSSTGHIFRFLHYEEWRNGILMYRRLIRFLAAAIIVATTVAVSYGLFRGFLLGNSRKSSVAYAVLCSVLPLFVGYALSFVAVRNAVTILTQWQIRRKMETLLQDLGTADYTPPLFPLKSVAQRVFYSKKYQTYRWFVPARVAGDNKYWSPYDAARLQAYTRIEHVDGLTAQDVLQDNLCPQLVHACATFKSRDAAKTEGCLVLLNTLAETPDGAQAIVDAGLLLVAYSLFRDSPEQNRDLVEELLTKLGQHPQTASVVKSCLVCFEFRGVMGLWIVIPEMGQRYLRG